MALNEKVNCLNIAYLFKTSLGSINGSWTEGNVSTVKKITRPDGMQLPYVSGQSLKRQIRNAWRMMGLENMLSEVKQTEIKAGVNFTEGDPAKYLDDDLLGYMITAKKGSGDENRRRTAAVRTSAAIGLFPFRNDRDLGTKSKEETGGDMGAGGNMFETEIYYNYFRVNILVELDRLGNFQDFELAKANKGKDKSLSMEERRKRVKYLLQALSHVWGGGKQSRLLTDMSPKFLAITFQTTKNPIFLETLTVRENEELHTEAVNEVLKSNEGIIAHKTLGIQSGIFKNADLVTSLSGTVSVQAAFDNAITHLANLDF